MGDKATYAVQVDKNSDLYEEFEEYKSRGGFTSTSEALRHVIREELDKSAESAGPWATLSKVAGDELSVQLRLLGWFMTFTAVALWAFETGLLGGYVWAAGAAVFGFLTFTTLIGTLVGLADVLNPSGVESPSSTADTDEVEA